MKTCTKCGQEKSLEDFPSRAGKARARCKSCVQEYWKEWYSDPENARKHKQRVQKVNRRREREAGDKIAELKDKPCVDCGGTFHPWQMDFDHVKGEKVKDVSRMRTSSMDRILREIGKCDLVCANCHRHRTYMRLHAGVA